MLGRGCLSYSRPRRLERGAMMISSVSMNDGKCCAVNIGLGHHLGRLEMLWCMQLIFLANKGVCNV